jgi:predicted glycogen debranching enzyme
MPSPQYYFACTDSETGACERSLILGRDAVGGFENATRNEWLLTNGIGGYASSTIGLLNTRRYHGLLVASLRPPVERIVVVAKADTIMRYAGVSTSLATNEYGDGTIDPRGYAHLDSFHLEGQHPVWTWIVADAVLEQRIWMVRGRNTTYVQFHLVRASTQVELEVRPLCTYRDYHSLRRGHVDVGVMATHDGLQVSFPDARPYRIGVEGGNVTVAPDWYWNFRHREESARGLDELGDLFMPGVIHMTLSPGATSSVVLSLDSRPAMSTDLALREDLRRQSELFDVVKAKVAQPVIRSSLEKQLILAADQFIVERDNTDGLALGKTVIAGYPWFADWGRDTMIALPGLTLATGRFDISASVLRTFASFLDEGMLPNRFPDGGEKPEYNTADATLWFFVAIDEYVRATSDESLRKDLYPALKESLTWHMRGTRFGIAVDAKDALLTSGVPGVQLTWMDAKVGDWVVTPRIGKCVEINALWYNALHIMRGFANQENDVDAERHYSELIERVADSFDRRFWFVRDNHLFDVVDGPEGELDELGRRCDATLRPNQLFALSLRHPLLTGVRARAVVDVCARRLWTPVGLRTLAPDDSRFVSRYMGAQRERDGAYHQGTVWGWLLGPFALAHFRAYGDADMARKYLTGVEAHLREGCIGQASEIFDGSAPFTPRGCSAQAWSVAEILRAWRQLGEH